MTDAAPAVDGSARDDSQDPFGVRAAVRERRHRRRRWPRRIAVAIAVILGLFVVYYAICLFEVWSTSRDDEARPVDAIVVMGAAQFDGRPSPVLASRLDHALDLYQRGIAPRIFVTGGKQPLDRFTEAATGARYLEERGVPAAAILREDEGRTSWQTLGAVATELERLGLRSVLLVSDPYHSARIKGMADELGLAAYVSPTPSSPLSGFSAFKKMAQEAAGVGLARVIGYDRMTDVTE